MSHSDTRLSILLNGFEYHLYNRSELYSRLEKLFGLDALIISGGGKDPDKEKDSDNSGKSPPKPPSAVGYSWRDLIPVIKLELSCVSIKLRRKYDIQIQHTMTKRNIHDLYFMHAGPGCFWQYASSIYVGSCRRRSSFNLYYKTSSVKAGPFYAYSQVQV